MNHNRGNNQELHIMTPAWGSSREPAKITRGTDRQLAYKGVHGSRLSYRLNQRIYRNGLHEGDDTSSGPLFG